MAIAAERKRLEAMAFYEKKARLRGFQMVAGVDEAGRGPLAGPVVAAACVLPDPFCIEGIDDSKKLKASTRERLFEEIINTPGVRYGIGVIDSILIDQINILQATFQAMLIAISQLPKEVDYLLIDGNRLPSTAIEAEAVVKGDSLSSSIAAASILAKVIRDRLMGCFHMVWPEFGLDAHKGYGTKAHLAAIEEHGASPIHRKTFLSDSSHD